jgi:hypothetical protein
VRDADPIEMGKIIKIRSDSRIYDAGVGRTHH